MNFAIEASREHGLQRLSAGYNISMLVTGFGDPGAVVFDLVRERLLFLDTSNLLLDLKRFNLGLQCHQSNRYKPSAMKHHGRAAWDESWVDTDPRRARSSPRRTKQMQTRSANPERKGRACCLNRGRIGAIAGIFVSFLH